MVEGSSQEFIIRPPTQLTHLDIRELLRYRHMLLSRVRKGLKAKFLDMRLGYAWAVAQPVTVVAVFVWLKKATAAQIDVSLPYPLYLYAGLILWYFFVNATIAVTASARRDSGLLKKVYFPRLISPLVPLLEHLVELSLCLVPLAFMTAWYGITPSWRLVFLPAVMLQCAALTLGTGCLFAAWSLRNPDMEKILRHTMYIGLFLSPVIYAPKASWHMIYHANPMAGTLLAFRSCLFRDTIFPTGAWLYALMVTFLLLVWGTKTYRRAEADFLDEL